MPGGHRSEAATDRIAVVPSADGPADGPETGSTPAGPSEPAGPRSLWRAGRPRASRAQIVVALLCAMLGFALVTQVRQTNVEGLAALGQSDLVRILDETAQRTSDLEREASALERTRQELLSGSNQRQAALDAAATNATTLGILSGRLPAEGPGIELTVSETAGTIPALTLFNLLEELRNSGAEAVQVNDHRVVASSYFLDTADGVELDGRLLEPPYHWLAIGDPAAMTPSALEIPGGAMSAIRNAGGHGTPQARDRIEVTATRVVPEPEFATPAPADAG